MAKTNTGAKAVKLSKPTHIIVTPYNGLWFDVGNERYTT